MKVTIGKGLALVCVVCKHEEFTERRAQLSTARQTWLGMDWLDRTARCYVCAGCGYVHLFLQP